MRKILLLTAIFISAVAVGQHGYPEGRGKALNFLVIMTDDQRWDTLWAMPTVKKEIVEKGVNFTNAFVTTPLCCPVRASLLSGGYYPHNAGVIANNLPNGGATKFDDRDTIATTLQSKGYKTGLVGKYLNDYKSIQPRIPPGWDYFATFFKPNEGWDWYKTHFVTGSSTATKSGNGEYRIVRGVYQTDLLRDKSLEFIEKYAGEPFFLYVATHAPHLPATPAKGDEKLYPDYVFDSPGLHESDLSDKPKLIRKKYGKFDEESDSVDEEDTGNEGIQADLPTRMSLVRRQLRSLMAVDRLVAATLAKLEEKGVLQDTVIIFTSDNGYMWGEHGLFHKGKPYEEAIRVPLVMRYPDTKMMQFNELVAVNLDLPATILDIAGTPKKSDGLSLQKLLHSDKAAPWREGIFFQMYGSNKPAPSSKWVAWRTDKYKYIEYPVTGDKELYDLASDPYELESRHKDEGLKDLMENSAGIVRDTAGLMVLYNELPEAHVGKEYSFKFELFGGKAPYEWKFASGTLPPGIKFSAGGLIGTPRKKGKYKFSIIVHDSSTGTKSGSPQSFTAKAVLNVSDR